MPGRTAGMNGYAAVRSGASIMVMLNARLRRNAMVWQSKEDQRAHIRAQLIYEVNNPSDWYYRSKKPRDKPRSVIQKMGEKDEK